ncbi:uncharacterized protein LOC122192269 isoform X3 [Lagopus leucura]|uniref:uncharacterized protein LOC122192269 isoform X3 n=1 Tax=Lagopus leucura TaxID=30410 RepID=UPI001C677149|nr:uncharacterized protein LOC122192269 isoform X3 [Lagopus leucura]
MHVSWKLHPSLPPLNPCAFCINPTPTLGSSSTSRAGAGCDSAVCTNAAGTRVHTRACRHLRVCMCANVHPMPAHELTHANLPFTDTHVQARTVHIRCTHTCAPTAHTRHAHVHILPPPPRAHRAQRPRDTAGWDKVHRAPCSALLLLLLLLLSSCCWRCSAPAPKQFSSSCPIPVSPPALLPRHISSLIPILQSLEVDDTLDIPSLVRALGGCGTPVCHTLLGDPPPTPKPIPELWTLLAHLLHPNTTAEHGLVLAPDGSTVALAPLFAGIEVGLKRAAGWPGPIDQPNWAALDALYAVTIAEALGTSFLMARVNGTAALGPDGCWDDVDNPQNFTPLGPPSLVPDVVANGAMDGVLLGTRLAEEPIPLSVLFRRYYGVENGIIRGWPHSSRRRQDFGALTAVGKLEEEVVAMLRVLRGLSPTCELLEEFGEEEEAGIAHRAAREFMEVYVAPHAAPSPPVPATCAPCSSSTRTPVAGMTSATASWWVRMDTFTKGEVGTGWVPIPEVTTPRVTEWATWATSQPACRIPKPSLWCAMASYRVP